MTWIDTDPLVDKLAVAQREYAAERAAMCAHYSKVVKTLPCPRSVWLPAMTNLLLLTPPFLVLCAIYLVGAWQDDLGTRHAIWFGGALCNFFVAFLYYMSMSIHLRFDYFLGLRLWRNQLTLTEYAAEMPQLSNPQLLGVFYKAALDELLCLDLPRAHDVLDDGER